MNYKYTMPCLAFHSGSSLFGCAPKLTASTENL